MDFFEIEMKETQIAGFIATAFRFLNTAGWGPSGPNTNKFGPTRVKKNGKWVYEYRA